MHPPFTIFSYLFEMWAVASHYRRDKTLFKLNCNLFRKLKLQWSYNSEFRHCWIIVVPFIINLTFSFLKWYSDFIMMDTSIICFELYKEPKMNSFAFFLFNHKEMHCLLLLIIGDKSLYQQESNFVGTVRYCFYEIKYYQIEPITG